MESYRDLKRWKQILNNNHSRYHYLKEDKDKGIPELIIDFKHYYTIHIEVLYNSEDKYLCSLDDLYKEDLSQRFASYLSRIGLPIRKEDSTINSRLIT